jgi:hypothetical protein
MKVNSLNANVRRCVLRNLTPYGIVQCSNPEKFRIQDGNGETLVLCHDHGTDYASLRFEDIENELACSLENAAARYGVVQYLSTVKNVSSRYYMRATNAETGRMMEWWTDDLRFALHLVDSIESMRFDVTIWFVDQPASLYRELYPGEL